MRTGERMVAGDRNTLRDACVYALAIVLER